MLYCIVLYNNVEVVQSYRTVRTREKTRKTTLDRVRCEPRVCVYPW